MREIAVLGCSVPVFYPCRNFYGVAGMKLASLFSPFLIPTPAFGAEQELTAVFVGLMNVPVIAAAGFKSHVSCGYAANLTQRFQIAVSDEVLCESFVWFAKSEDSAVSFCRILLLPDLFDQAESGPCLWPAGVECGVGEDFRNFLSADAVFLCRHQMILE